MAMWLFTKAIFDGRPIDVFGQGRMRRDFTYIDDIIAGVVACLDTPPGDDGAVKAGGSVSRIGSTILATACRRILAK
jgi:UDP-glucuronate 4-epimerase